MSSLHRVLFLISILGLHNTNSTPSTVQICLTFKCIVWNILLCIKITVSRQETWSIDLSLYALRSCSTEIFGVKTIRPIWRQPNTDVSQAILIILQKKKISLWDIAPRVPPRAVIPFRARKKNKTELISSPCWWRSPLECCLVNKEMSTNQKRVPPPFIETSPYLSQRRLFWLSITIPESDGDWGPN